MATRVFDTYGGSEDAMVEFINSVSDKFILCIAIQVATGVGVSFLFPILHSIPDAIVQSEFKQLLNGHVLPPFSG